MPSTSNRKQEIHTAAAHLFGQKGFSACSVRDIASAVGLGAASLYNHIGSKDELLTTICFRCAHQFSKGMDEIEKAPTQPHQKIEALIKLHIHIALHDKSSITVFNDEWKHLQEPHLTSFLSMRRSYESRYLRIIQQGIDDHQLPCTDAFVMYQWILSSLRWLHLNEIKKSPRSETELTEQIINLINHGIRP